VLNDAGAAEDVVQESFLAVWRQAERFDAGRGSVRTWLCTIVHNRALDRLRGRRGRSRLDVSMEAAPGLAVPDSWEQVAEGLTRDAVRRALDQLPQEQRETVDLAYYGGLSQTEISQRMEVPLGTVKGRTRLALRRLHQLLAGEVLEGSV
jgi:RNA polymerase sigma-70 factor, ECF subfamily